jgi:hypothetical protein
VIWLLALGALFFVGYEVYVAEQNAGNGGTSSGNSFIDALANAIANAEGSDPSINNPGDLTGGDFNPSNVVGTFNSAGVAIVDTIQNGWSALYNKLSNILNGGSSVYSPDMTISDFANTYTGGDNAASWAQSVADALGVTVDTTLSDAQAIFNGDSGGDDGEQ